MTENQRIKILRKESGFSQIELAKAMGLDQSSISAIEGGKNKVTENFKILFSHITNCRKDFIETGLGAKFNEKKTNHPTKSNVPPPENLINEDRISLLRSDFADKEKMYRELIAEKDKRLAEKDELIKVLKEQLATKSTKAGSAIDPGALQR